MAAVIAVPDAPVMRGQYRIKNVKNGLYWDIKGGSKSAKARLIQWTYKQDDQDGNANQKFYFEYANQDGYLTIKNWNSQMLIDVAGGTSKNGETIWQYPENGTDAQLWKFTKVDVANSKGVYQIENKGSGKVVSIKDNSQNAGAYLHQWQSYDNFWPMQWQLEPFDYKLKYKITNFDFGMSSYPAIRISREC